MASDNFGGGQLAAQTLTELGCKRLLVLQQTVKTPGEVDKRRLGFNAWCESNGVEYTCLHAYENKDDPVQWSTFWRFLEEHMSGNAPEYDGIFCCTDHLAVHTCRKLRRLGLRVPEQVQVIGFDGLQQFGGEDYYCSTIAQPVKEMAELAVDLLMNPDRSKLPVQIYLPVSYQPGGTTRDGGENPWPANI